MRITIERTDAPIADCRWQAWEPDRYDGCEDGYNHIGSGATPEAALEDYLWHLDLEVLPADAVVVTEGTR
jgi:hypothetical protein